MVKKTSLRSEIKKTTLLRSEMVKKTTHTLRSEMVKKTTSQGLKYLKKQTHSGLKSQKQNKTKYYVHWFTIFE